MKTIILKAFLIILTLTCFLYPSISYSQNYVFNLLWPHAIVFKDPVGIAVDSNMVYIVDDIVNKVIMYDFFGQPAATIGTGVAGSANDQFKSPKGVAVDNNFNVYVADTGNNRIQKFAGATSWSATIGSSSGAGTLSSPSGVALDSLGNVYVTDSGNNRILKFNSVGAFQTEWGIFANATDTLYYPTGVAVDNSGYVYVADSGNHRILKFSSTGNPLQQWGDGVGSLVFSSPNGVAVDSSGFIYVSDIGSHNIQKFKPDGSEIIQWGTWGYGNLNLDCPYGVAVSSLGSVYVADSHNYRVNRYDSNGNYLDQLINGDANWINNWALFYCPNGVAVNSLGDVYVADTLEHRIRKFDSGGNLLIQWGIQGTGNYNFNSPSGLAVDSLDNLYVADTYNHRILKYNSSGIFSATWGNYGSGGGIGNVRFKYPWGVAVDSSGYVYVSDTGNYRIQKFDLNGNFLSEWQTLAGDINGAPNGVAVDSLGNVYVANTSQHLILKYTNTGNPIGPPLGGGNLFNSPSGLAVDSLNNLYVADTGSSHIQKFSSSGVPLTQFGPVRGYEDGQFNYPRGVAVTPQGNKVYVADTYNHRIQKFNLVNDSCVITSLTPACGPTAGGTIVTINGTGFGTIPGTVEFGGFPATFPSSGPFWTDTVITCKTPPQTGPGSVIVEVTNSLGVVCTLSPGFTYDNTPVTIFSLTPHCGPIAGGTPVTIVGTGFGNTQGTGTVTFGVSSGTLLQASIDNWTDTVIKCTTPAHACGQVDVIVTNSCGATGVNSFTYGSIITSVTPAGGPIAAGTIVTIVGECLGVPGTVTFGGMPIPASGIISWTNTEIKFEVPVYPTAGPVNVILTTNNSCKYTLSFTYCSVTITSVTPAGGPIAGGTPVIINGTGFGTSQGTGSVMFGGIPIPATDITSWTNTEIKCKTPPHACGLVNVVVTDSLGCSFTLVNGFSYCNCCNVTITSVTPACGPLAGDTPVTIVVTGVSADQGIGSVMFGGVAATDITWDSTQMQITCMTPAHLAVGAVNVVVTTSDGCMAILPLGFTYSNITITSVTPNCGPIAGGTQVTIKGTGFLNTQCDTPGTVTFDGMTANNIIWVSDAEITCVTPPHAAGPVGVVVTNCCSSKLLKNGFTYGCKINSVTPACGPIAGDTKITIVGTCFGDTQGTVTFDDGIIVTDDSIDASNFFSWSDTSIICMTPPHAAGAVNVVVTNSLGEVCIRTNGFTYCQITSVTPNEGPTTGNTTVTIVGTCFGDTQGTSTVMFGGTAATFPNPGSSWSNNSITCVTPPHAAGPVDVVVSGCAGTLVNGFVFIDCSGPNPPCKKLNPNLSIISTEASPGSKFTTQLSLNEMLGVTGGDIVIKYDPSVLTVGDVVPTKLASDMSLAPNTSVSGQIKIAMASVKALLSGSGPLVDIAFTVNPKAIIGTETKIQLVEAELYDESGKSIPINIEDGTIKIVQACIKGDVNNDGNIRSNDAMLILRIAAGLLEPNDYQKCAADVNGDGKIRSNDAMLVLRQAAGIEAAPVKDFIADRRINISLSEAHGLKGETITVPITVDNIDVLSSGDMSISYDSRVLRAIGILSGDGLLMADNISQPGLIRISFVGVERLNNGKLAEIRFEVLTDNVSPLTFKMAELYGTDALPLNSKFTNKQFRSWAVAPELSALMQNYPNPFNPETWIPYQLNEDGEVVIRIHNVAGDLVHEIRLGYKPAGLYTTQDRSAYWNGKNEAGEKVSSGLYFYTIQAGKYTATRKMLLLK
jgi:DNA-binding beta-propeller fold protein YncE